MDSYSPGSGQLYSTDSFPVALTRYTPDYTPETTSPGVLFSQENQRSPETQAGRGWVWQVLGGSRSSWSRVVSGIGPSSSLCTARPLLPVVVFDRVDCTRSWRWSSNPFALPGIEFIPAGCGLLNRGGCLRPFCHWISLFTISLTSSMAATNLCAKSNSAIQNLVGWVQSVPELNLLSGPGCWVSTRGTSFSGSLAGIGSDATFNPLR